MADQRGQRTSTKCPEYKTWIEFAVKDLTSPSKRLYHPQGEQVTQGPQAEQPNVAPQIARQTLSNCVKGIHKARHQVYKVSRLLKAQGDTGLRAITPTSM